MPMGQLVENFEVPGSISEEVTRGFQIKGHGKPNIDPSEDIAMAQDRRWDRHGKPGLA